MRGEDLLDQRRARARQPDDENRLVAGDAESLALAEELLRADFLLIRRIPLDRFGLVAAFGALECVAALVAAPRCGVITTILVGLAERETQVIAVDDARARGGLGGVHPLELGVAEAVGLEVRKAPPGVTEPGPGAGCCAVLLDRLGLASERLQRMGG